MSNIKNHNFLPFVLVILDGWGIAAKAPGNAISQAQTINLKKYITAYPATTLLASGEAVGLPKKQAGNSEVGHQILGLGRLSPDPLNLINKAINDATFFSNPALLQAFEHSKINKSKVHVCTLLSQAGINGQIDHLYALLLLIKNLKAKNVFLHLILDGVDQPPNSGKKLLTELISKIAELKVDVQIASLSGSYYALDNNYFWQRTAKTFSAMARGQSEEYFTDPLVALDHSYEQEIFDQYVNPTVIVNAKNKKVTLINENDSLIFTNLHRAKILQLTKAFCLPDFTKFERGIDYRNLFVCTFLDYCQTLPVDAIAWPKIPVTNSLMEILSQHNFRQLYIAETEKYCQLTYFFSGHKNEPAKLAEWKIIPLPLVSTYAAKPNMSVNKVADHVLQALSEKAVDFVAVNFANPDLVGHTGDLKATIKACEACDKALHKIVQLVLSQNGAIIITADHGMAEELQNIQTQEINKEHTTNPVPLVIVANDYEGKNIGLPDVLGDDLSLIAPTGTLADVAPTILKILGIKKPSEMTGKSLI
jgi:2,3-bisphosphoglycerate-independent phosphoglycerate mutase